MPGKLTTHVLDTAHRKPAAGVMIELYRIDPDQRRLVTSLRTNADGRTDLPLLEGLQAGTYELVFFVGDYFGALASASGGVPFLDRVPVRFGVDDPNAHYHVPLLVSPWAYSTYRGS